MGFNLRTFLPLLAVMVVGGIVASLVQKITLAVIVWFLAGVLGVAFFAWLAYEMKWLPGGAMRFLDPYFGKAGQNSKFKGLTADAVAERVDGRLVGQDELMAAAVAALRPKFVQRSHQGAFFSALLTGPKGSGKSTFARVLAGGVYGSEADIIEVNCEKIGADGVLAVLNDGLGGRLMRDAEQVVLFDKVDAAFQNPDAVKALVEFVEEGRVGGKRLAGRACVVLTVDVAGEQAGSEAAGLDPKAASAAVRAALKGQVPDALLKVVDLVDATRPLGNQELAEVGYASLIDMALKRFGVTVREIDALAVARTGKAWQSLSTASSKDAQRWLYAKAKDTLGEAVAAGFTTVDLAWDADGDGGEGAYVATGVATAPAAPAALVAAAAAPAKATAPASAAPAETTVHADSDGLDVPPPTRPQRQRKPLV